MHSDVKLHQFDNSLKIYMWMKIIINLFQILLAVAICPFLIIKIRQQHRYEYNLQKYGFVLYTIIFTFYYAFEIWEHWYLVLKLTDTINPNTGLIYDHIEVAHSNICFLILGPQYLFLPLVIVLFKRSTDIFMAFSKIDGLS